MFADAGSMPCESLILLGRLSPDDTLGNAYNGEIIFSDRTASIVCEVGRAAGIIMTHSYNTIE